MEAEQEYPSLRRAVTVSDVEVEVHKEGSLDKEGIQEEDSLHTGLDSPGCCSVSVRRRTALIGDSVATGSSDLVDL